MSFLHKLKNILWCHIPEIHSYDEETSYSVLGKKGRCRLLYYGRHQSRKSPAILIIPSLINNYKILDLSPQDSVIAHLVEQGYEVYLLDWSDPRPMDGHAGIEDHVTRWMNWAVNKTLEHSKHEQLTLFGHCLGGTLSAIYTCLFPQKVKNLILLTAPIDFEKDSLLKKWVNLSPVNFSLMKEINRNISEKFLGDTFKWIQPLGELRKKQSLWARGENNQFIKKYKAIEKWLAHGIDFPGQAYQELISEFYQKNKLFKNELHYCGQDVFLNQITCPLLCLWADEDVIVPAASACAVLDKVRSQITVGVALKGGHIGCLLSDKHRQNLILKISTWLNNREEEENDSFMAAKNLENRFRNDREEFRKAH